MQEDSKGTENMITIASMPTKNKCNNIIEYRKRHARRPELEKCTECNHKFAHLEKCYTKNARRCRKKRYCIACAEKLNMM